MEARLRFSSHSAPLSENAKFGGSYLPATKCYAYPVHFFVISNGKKKRGNIVKWDGIYVHTCEMQLRVFTGYLLN